MTVHSSRFRLLSRILHTREDYFPVVFYILGKIFRLPLSFTHTHRDKTYIDMTLPLSTSLSMIQPLGPTDHLSHGLPSFNFLSFTFLVYIYKNFSFSLMFRIGKVQRRNKSKRKVAR